MEISDTDTRLKDQVYQLEQAVAKLITINTRLSSENDSLKTRETQLLRERADLHSKNDKIRTQVEAMIIRLKAMENA